MEKLIEIYPAGVHEAKAYEVFCAKRFRALKVERVHAGTYKADEEIIEVMEVELAKAGVRFTRVSEDSVD